MKKLLVLIALAFVFVSGAAFAAEFVEGEVLVVIEAPAAAMSVAQSNANAFASALSAQAQTYASSVGAQAVATYPEIAKSGKNIVFLRKEGATTAQLIADVKKAGGVLSVSPNYITRKSKTPNDPHYSKLWGMGNIGADKVWDNITGSSSVVVAVIDEGIDFAHEDLKDNLATDSYGNHGRIFYPSGVSTGGSVPDDHGTHVAGTIGAVGDNGKGVAGVNWKVKLLGADVLGPGGGNINAIAGAINYIVGEKSKGLDIRAANMSLNLWEFPSEMPDNGPFGTAIKSLSDNGIIACMSAGNDGVDIEKHGRFFSTQFGQWVEAGELSYPACFRFANTITVGAIQQDNGRADFSNYSPKYVDIAAPGVKILSTVTLTYEYESGDPGNGYAYFDGTSMATPMTAGAAALLCAAYPEKPASDIKALLMNNATAKDTTLWLKGLLNVKAAYNAGGGIPEDAEGAKDVFDPSKVPGGNYEIEGSALKIKAPVTSTNSGTSITLISATDFGALFSGDWTIDASKTDFRVSPSGATLSYTEGALKATFTNTTVTNFAAWLPISKEIAESAIAATQSAHVKLMFSGNTNAAPVPPTPTNKGSSGCSAGYASLALFALIPLAFRKKK